MISESQNRFPFIPVFVILGLSALLYGSLISRYRTGVFNDDAVYVLVASDLRHRGDARLLSTVRPDYPLPGLPVFLAPLTFLVGTDWVQLEWVSVIVTLVTLVLLVFWLSPWLSTEQLMCLIILYAWNPTVVKSSGVVMPTSYFSLATVSSFLLMGRILRQPTLYSCLGLGCILGWASVVRAEGISLLLGVWCGLWWGKVPKRVYLKVAVPIIIWVGVTVYWFQFRGVDQSDLSGDLHALSRYWSNHFWAGIQFLGSFLHLMFIRTLLAIDLKPNSFSSVIGTVTVLGAVGLCAAGIRSLWRTQKEKRAELVGMGVFLVLYLVAHTFWHVALPRYCLTLLPLVLLFLGTGKSDRFPLIQRHPRLLILAISPFLLTYGYNHSQSFREISAERVTMNAPAWRTLEWIREHAPPSRKIMSPFSASIALYTKRPAVPVIHAADVESFRYALQHEAIELIADRPMQFVSPGVGKTENLNKDWDKVRRWTSTYPLYFPLLFQDSREHTRLYRVHRDEQFIEGYSIYYSALREMHAGRLDSAYTLVEKSRALYPLGLALNLKGVIHFSREQYSDAEREFRSATQLLPDSSMPLFNLASVYHRTGRTLQAVEVLNQGLGVVASNGNTHRRFSNIQSLMSSWDRKSEMMFY